MPRIMGIDLPNDKPTHISLRYIRGIGPTTSLEVCAKAKVNPQRKARELNKVFQLHQSVLNTMAECNSLLRGMIFEDNN